MNCRIHAALSSYLAISSSCVSSPPSGTRKRKSARSASIIPMGFGKASSGSTRLNALRKRFCNYLLQRHLTLLGPSRGPPPFVELTAARPR